MNLVEKAVQSGYLLRDLTPYSNLDPLEYAKKVMAGEYYLPHIGQIFFQNTDIDWAINFKSNEKSTLLWLYSLVFIDYLTKAFVVEKDRVYLQKAAAIFTSFEDWLAASVNHQQKVFQDEHCVSNRALILLQFSHVLSNNPEITNNNALETRVNNHIRECCNWLSDDSHYALNNHGIIMDRTLLSAFVFFQEADFPESPSWKAKALARLDMMIKRTFDKDGCCTENSTSYHVLNVSLFQAIKNFMDRHRLVGLADDYLDRLKKAEESVAFQVYENGELPTIGDSYKKPSVFLDPKLHQNKFGAAVYAESGLVFIKKPNFYFSFKCGGKTTSHRHVDDTSITLQVSGRHFICDGGMQSYDPKDPIRHILASYKSHSGVFTEDCANFRFKNFPNPTDISSIEHFQYADDFVSAAGVSCLDFESQIRREVVWSESAHIAIFDSIYSEVKKKWRIQFLLHPEVIYDIGKNSLTLKNGEEMVRLNFVTTADYEISVEDGYYSEAFMAAVPTKLLVIAGCGQSLSFKTFIKVMHG